MILDHIVIRTMLESDIDEMHEIEKTCFSRPWSRQDIAKLLTDDKAFYLVAVDENSNSVVGYVGAYIIYDEADINQVAVASAYRRCGIGKKLLQDFMQKMSEKGIYDITLEVRASNEAAIALYSQSGFRTEGVRKQFYELPTEDAYIMWKHKE